MHVHATDTTSDAALTGLLFPIEAAAESADYMPYSVEEEIIEALETDEQVTGTCAAELFLISDDTENFI